MKIENSNIVELENITENKNLFEFLKNNKSIELDLITKLNGFYITLKLDSDYLDIPFNYICINTNKKLNGIPYINFENICSSKELGLCKVEKYCYSVRDQNRFENNNNKIRLNVLFFELVQKDSDLFNKVTKFLSAYKYIRFNCNNDINNIKNIEFLIKIAQKLENSIISGYTNRFDLIKNKKHLESFNIPKNLIINGSNYMLTNNYITTTNLKKYFDSDNKCLGSCSNCLKCFNLKNENIICLLHGSKNMIDSVYNTHENRLYLIEFFKNNFDIVLSEEDLTIKNGLLNSLNYSLESKGYNLKIKNYTELKTVLNSNRK